MKTIKKGNNGIEVTILQQLLNYHGIEVNVDGDFGENTEKAVINFQLNNFDENGHNLNPDGQVGKLTWRSLIETELGDNAPSTAPEDHITVKRIQTIHPTLADELAEIYLEIRERGVNVRFSQVYRTFEEQDKLFAKGRTAPGRKVTNARGGQSYHNYGMAVDIVLLTPGGGVSWDRTLDQDLDNVSDWDEIVFVFKHYGWKWGGDWTSFKDYPHFEKTFGFTTSELLAKYQAGDFVKDQYVDLS